MTTDAPPVDLAAIAEDARRRLLELQDERRSLSLDAIENPDAAEQLRDVESLITSAKDEIEHALLAESELAKREVEAAESAKREARAAALAKADMISARLKPAARAVDRCATELASAIAAHSKLYAEDVALRVEAGVRSQPSGWEPGPGYEAALRVALRAEGVPTEGPAPAMAFREGASSLRGGLRPLAQS